MRTLAYGLVALVALTALAALAPSAAADPLVDTHKCTPDPLPQRCVDVYSDPDGGCYLRVFVEDFGGPRVLCFT